MRNPLDNITQRNGRIAAVLLLLMWASVARAADRYWVANGGSANWNTSANWSATSGGAGSAGVPGSGDQAIFDGNGTANCNIDTTVTISSLTISSVTAGGYLGSVNTQNNTVTLSSNLLISTGTFTAGSSTITISGTVTFNTGVFNANTSSMTISGDINLFGGTFNAGGSTTTASGNWTNNSVNLFNGGSSTLVLTGTSKSIAGNFPFLWNLTISGTYFVQQIAVNGVLNVSGTATLNNQLWLVDAATATLSGTVNGPSNLYIYDSAVLGTGGTLNSGVVFQSTAKNVSIPARTYGGMVQAFTNGASNFSAIPSAGSHVYNLGLFVQQLGAGNITYDASVNNPTVTVTTVTFNHSGSGAPIIKAGSGVWSVSRDFDLRNGTMTQTANGIIRFNGSVAQNVYSSTNTYFQIDITNASSGGVDFKDGFTVSTFTATTANALLKFAPAPATMVVTKYLNLNGQTANTQVLLRSEVSGSAWQLNRNLVAGQVIKNANIQDSDATSGSSINAANISNTDNGNNTNWTFGTANRYWVAGSVDVWSNIANWSATSGGGGGAPLPGLANDAIFDAGGLGDCAVDISAIARSITISTSTTGGYTGSVDTQGNAVTTVQGFTQNNGTFFGRAAVITVGGDWTRAPGATFTAGTSKISFNGTGAQAVNSSSATYYQIDIANASSSGVSFNDTLTVSTFSALVPNARAKFAINTASMTVKTYFNVNGQLPTTSVKLRSLTDGTSWQLVLSTGITQNVKNTNPKDSNASKGIAAAATDASNTDSGNNTYWNFPSDTGRYWIASAPGVWSDPANWSITSGGPGGYSVPTATQAVTFDGFGQGNCTIDTSVNISTLTISTATSGGYSGIINTQSNSIVLSQGFTLNFGTFTAQNSQMNLLGDFTIAGGAFDAGTSSITASGNVTVATNLFAYGSSSLNLVGNNKTLSGGTPRFWNVTISSTTTGINTPQVNGVLNVVGTLNLNTSSLMSMGSGSTTTISGIINGPGTLVMNTCCTATPGGSVLGAGGTLNAPVYFYWWTGNFVIPSRTYNGLVTMIFGTTGVTSTAYMGAGTHVYNGGLHLFANAGTPDTGILDGSANNPTVNINNSFTIDATVSSTMTVNAGAGAWTINGPVSLSSSTFNANSATMVFQSSVTISTGAVINAGTAQITFSTSVLMSSGTFNANTSSITVSGDMSLNNGVFNAAGSTITVAGNLTVNNSANLAFNYATSSFILSGTGKTFTLNNNGSIRFYNISVPGTISTFSGSPDVAGTLTVGGTLTLANGMNLDGSSVVNLTGTLNGGIIESGGTLGTGGTLNASVTFFNTGLGLVPARVYNGLVSFSATCCGNTYRMLPGAHTYNAGISVGGSNSSSVLLDAGTNNPTVNVIGSVATSCSSNGTTSVTMGSGTWTVSGNWDMRPNGCAQSTLSQSVGGLLRLNGTTSQNVYSSSAAYSQIDVVNVSTGGVLFHDSLTVSTFTALQGGTTIQFAILPSSLTVTNFLGLGPAVSGSTVSLRSASSGTRWSVLLGSAATTNIVNTNVQDSEAGYGIMVYATSGTNVNAGNNNFWDFSGGVTRYWVAGTAKNWSDPTAWSLTSNGATGAGAPLSSDTAIFDGGGLGNCTIDTAVYISSLTISSITAGGYTGTINTSSNAITMPGNFTMSTGTFNTMGSTLAVNGSFTLNAGVFNAQSSSATIGGDLTVNSPGIFNAALCTWAVGGNLSSPINSAFNMGTSLFAMTGSNKSIGGGGPAFYNVTVTGSNIHLGSIYINGNLAITGSLDINGTPNMMQGSSVTLTGAGTLSGPNNLSLNGPVYLNTGGTITAQLTAYAAASTLPARTYGGVVHVGSLNPFSGTALLGPGTFNFNGGLSLDGSGTVLLDASLNNPTVNVASITFTGTTGPQAIKAGSGSWTVTGPMTLSSGTFNANSANIVFQSSVTLSTGAVFNANTAQITFSTGVFQSTGTFNANTSSVTILGDLTLTGGTFNANGSTWTAMGNMTASVGSPQPFQQGTSLFNFNGNGKTISNFGNGLTFYNLNIYGNTLISFTNGGVNHFAQVFGTMTFTQFGGFGFAVSASLSYPGTVTGAPGFLLYNGTILPSTGTLNAPFMARAGAVLAPATYGGAVNFQSPGSVVLSSGAYVFANGISLTGGVTLDASVNNPTVTVSSGIAAPGAGNALNMGSGTWTVSGDWNFAGAVSRQSAAGILRLNGTGLQNVYSSSATYFAIDDVNVSTGGIRFQDSLTVSTFTALQGGTTIQFALDPSSLTITGYLGLGPSVAGSTVSLRSALAGSPWGLRLSASATSNVFNTNVQDSDASGGILVNASSSTNVNAGNNTFWIFAGGTSRYWVAGTAKNWSDSTAWALSSGGTSGVGPPLSSDAAIFDGNGLGTCTIDTAVNISSLTISSITAGGYTGTINTSSNSITLANSFTMSTGTFNAMGSTITIGGDTFLNAGIFNAGKSTLLLQGNFSTAISLVFNYSSSTLSLGGSGKTATGTNPLGFWNVSVPGTATWSVANGGTNLCVQGTLNVAGTLTLASPNFNMNAGSTATISGTLNGGTMVLRGSTVLGTGGTLNASIIYDLTSSSNGLLPARTYNGSVSLQSCNGNFTLTLGGGTFNFAGGLFLQSACAGIPITIDGSANNPNVTVSTFSFVMPAATLNAGSGSWTIQNPVTLTTGTFNANSATIVFQSSVTLSTGAVFNANTAQITFSTGVVQSSGTFNANTSSMTVAGDMALNNGVFNENGSTLTVAGNLTINDNANLAFNSGTSSLILTGVGKTFTLTNTGTVNFYNLSVPGSVTTLLGSRSILGTLTVGGTLNSNNLNGTYLNAGSFLNLTGTLNGGLTTAGGTWGTGGTLNATVTFFNTVLGYIPARVYNGPVSLTASCCGNTYTLLAGTHTFNGGISVGGSNSSSVTLDAATNSPTVNVTGSVVTSCSSNGTASVALGSGTWTVSGNWDVRPNGCAQVTISQTTVGILRFNGTGQQQVYSSSAAYFAVDDVNVSTGGVRFQDSLTVSTFTALQAGTTIQFAVKPSSLTVTNYLGFGSSVAGSSVSLRSAVSGSQWGLRLLVGSTTSVVNTNVQDSDASGGAIVYATSGTNVDSGNNTSWVFTSTTSVTHYWVASSPANWSNPSVWSISSGGVGGAGVPQPSDTVIFDGNGLGTCTIDTAVSISTLTVSTSTAGSYTGTINTSSNPITLSGNFVQNAGIFNAMGSTLTVTGDVMLLNIATFNMNASTITVAGNWLNTSGGTILNPGSSTLTLTGNGKTFANNGSSNRAFNNLIISGTITNTFYTTVNSILNVSGTFTLSNGGCTHVDMPAGSTVTISGTINGAIGCNGVLGGALTLNDTAVLGAGGVINSLVNFNSSSANGQIPARDYGGLVSVNLANTVGETLGAGSINFNGGLSLSGNSSKPLDGSINNPTVTVSSLTITGTPAAVLNAGAGRWTVTNPVTFTTGTFNANSATLVFQSSVTLGAGAVFNANTAQITFSSNVVQSTGTFNANASSMTVTGDIAWNAGTFNAGASTITVAGNCTTQATTLLWIAGTSTLNLTGSGKTFFSGGQTTFWNLNIPGTITNSFNGKFFVNGAFNVSGTNNANAAGTIYANSGSTVTVTGTINQPNILQMVDSAVLSAGGTIGAPIVFQANAGNVIIPARTYSGTVTAYNHSSSNLSAIPASGAHTYNGGLQVQQDAAGNITYDASVNNPPITVSTVSFSHASTGSPIIKTGSGTWSVSRDFDLRNGSLTQTANGMIQFNGTGAQNVYSSSATYFQIDDVNTSTSGVRFQDSLTVSTFTALLGGTTIQFAVKPSSLTVTGYLGLGPAAGGSVVSLRSAVAGSQWGLRLPTGSTTSIVNTNVQDSDATSGQVVYATSGTNVDSGNNTSWVFTPGATLTRYWVASSLTNWSTPAAWSLTSGGAGGAGSPMAGDSVVFDSNGQGNCAIDTSVNLSSFTISTSTTGGYSGIITTQNNAVNLINAFTLNRGTFTAGSSQINVIGDVTIAGGAFNANTSTLTISGNSAIATSASCFNAARSNLILVGNKTFSSWSYSQFWNLTISSTTNQSGLTTVDGLLNVQGTLNIAGTVTTGTGSTTTLTGSINGPGSLVLNDLSGQFGTPAILGVGGTLNAPVTFDLWSANALIPARTYNGNVTVGITGGGGNLTALMQAGNHVYNAGLHMYSQTGVAPTGILNGSTNNPNVTINGDLVMDAAAVKAMTINTGSGSWTINGNMNLSTGTFNTTASSLSVSGAFALSTATFNANSTIVTAGSLTQSSGTFNANTSSMTVLGDMTLNGGNFNTGGSTITEAGNFTLNAAPSNFDGGSGTWIFTGSGKSITNNTPTFWNATISGSVTNSASIVMNGLLNVSGTLTCFNNISMSIGSTATVSGTMTGTATLFINRDTVLGTGGTINNPVVFFPAGGNVIIPARVYNGQVTFANNVVGLSGILGAGSVSFLGGLVVNDVQTLNVTLDASINNPNVTVTSVTCSATSTGMPIIKAGSGTWLVGNAWDLRGAQFSQGTGGIVRLNGTGQQTVYSSSNTYSQLDITNTTGGVQFRDSLTVATFTALSAGTTLQFGINPSSLTVTGYFALGAGSGAKTTLRSMTTNTRWGLRVPTGVPQTVRNVDAKDSDASGGAVILADNATSIDSGNNVNWQFNPITVTNADIAPASALQGSEVAVSSITLFGAASATFQSIRVQRLGFGPDSDVQLVRLYRESGATPGFQPSQDSLVVQVDSNAFVNGTAALTVTNSPGQIVGATPVSYYIVYLLNPNFIGGINDTVGVRISSATDLTFSGGGALPPGFPINSSLTQITKLIDTMTVTVTSLNTASIARGTNNVGFAKLTLTAARDRTFWSSLRVLRLGAGADNDLTGISIWKDANGDGLFDPSNDSLVSSGNDAFSAGVSVINLSSQTVTTGGQIYFLSANINAGATIGDTVGFRIGASTDVILLSSDVVDSAGYSKDTSTTSIAPAFNTLTLTTGTYTAPSSLQQGTTNAMQLVTFAVDTGNAIWDALSIGQIGTAVQGDINTVLIYRDNGDGVFQPAVDTRVSVSTMTFDPSGLVTLTLTAPETVTAGSPKSYWVVVKLDPSANIGATVQTRLTNSGAVRLETPYTTVAGNFPLISAESTISPTIDTLQVTPVDLTPATVLQAATDVTALKLSLIANSNTVGVFSLKVDRTGNGADSDITAIRIYKDTGNGTFGGPGEDTLVTAGNDALGNGSATLFFNSTQFVNTSTSVYFVTFDISGSAQVGKTVGLSIGATTYLTVTSPDLVSVTNFPMPNPVAPAVMTKQVATVQVSTSNLAPAGVDPGTNNLAVMRLTLSTNRNIATLTNLKFDRIGGNNTDVPSARVYLDSNNNGIFEAGIDQPISNIVSFDNSNQASIPLTISQTLTTTAKKYFVVVNVSTSAVPGDTFKLRWVSNAYLTVNAPDLVSNAIFPFDTAQVTVNEPPSTLTFTPGDVAPVSVPQDTLGVVMASFTMTADRYTAAWTRLRVDRAGTGADTDVTAVKLYLDDGNGTFGPEDTLITSGADGFVSGSANLALTTQTITTSAKKYFLVFDISAGASANKTLGATIGSSGFFTVISPDTVGAANLPFTTTLTLITPTVDTLTLVPTNLAPNLTQGDTLKAVGRITLSADSHAVVWTSLRVDLSGGLDSDISSVALYADTGDGLFNSADDPLITSGLNTFSLGSAILNLSASQTLTTAAKTYFLVVAVSPTATVGATLQFRVEASSYVSVDSPDQVSSSNFPLVFTSGGSINDLPDVLTVTLSTAVTTELYQGTAQYAFAKVTLQANQDQVILSRLPLAQYGTGADTDLTSLQLYADTDGSGDFSAVTDVAVTPPTPLSGGIVTLVPTTPLVCTPTPKTYFLVADVAATASVGDSLGFRIAAVNGIVVSNPDTASSANLPTQAPLGIVLDPHVPRTPLITLTSLYSNSPTRLGASWTSSVPQGSIVEYDYAIGTSTGDVDVVPFTSVGVATSVLRSNLLLSDGQRYYFSIKARSNTGQWSTTALSQGILIDSQKPEPPAALNTYIDGNSVAVTWAPATTGPSGVAAYYTYLRPGSSPQPVLVGTTSISGAFFGAPASPDMPAGISAQALTPSAQARSGSTTGVVVTNLAAGTYFFSVQTRSNAGLLSDRSSETKVLLGVDALPNAVSSVTNYPNPFDSRKGVTTINYTLNQDSQVEIKIYDVFGSKVKSMTLAGGQTGGQQGSNNVSWDGSDDSGTKVSKGIYICVVKADTAGGSSKETIKIGVIH